MITINKNFVSGRLTLQSYLKVLSVTTLLIFSGCGGGSSAPKNPTDTTAPVFTSSNTATVNENQISAITLVATDTNTITYGISGTDSASFDINTSTGVVTFKVAPDFEATPTKTSFTFTASAFDGTNTTTQSITININNVDDTTKLYIKSAIYDNNSTVTVDDDKLYLYFNKPIKESSISSVIGDSYDINGTGFLGSASSGIYDDNIFHRHKIFLNSNTTASTAFVSNETNISIKANTITDMNDRYPEDLNQTLVKNFNVLGRLKTGQTTSYETNDDGTYQRGITRSYTVQGEDSNLTRVVIDNATNLMWQDNNMTIGSANKKTWADAITYCDTLIHNGKSDWRLPSIEELVSITDKSRYNPAINSAFQNVVTSYYWSSTTDASGTSYAWVVNFNSGYDDGDGKTNTNYVRCVRPAVN